MANFLATLVVEGLSKVFGFIFKPNPQKDKEKAVEKQKEYSDELARAMDKTKSEADPSDLSKLLNR